MKDGINHSSRIKPPLKLFVDYFINGIAERNNNQSENYYRNVIAKDVHNLNELEEHEEAEERSQKGEHREFSNADWRFKGALCIGLGIAEQDNRGIH